MTPPTQFTPPPEDRAWTAAELRHLTGMTAAEISRHAGSLRRIDTGRALLRIENLRVVLYGLNALLATGGELGVDCIDATDQPYTGRRIGTQIQYEIASMFPGCYKLVGNASACLVFKKMAAGRNWRPAFDSLSVGYITDGRSLEQIQGTLEALSRLRNSAEVEVLLAGPAEKLAAFTSDRDWVRLVGDYKHDDLRAPINQKKWLIIDAAKGENLILVHDRFLLDDAFWRRLIEYGNDFDFYNCRHCALADAPRELDVSGAYGEHTWPIAGFAARGKSANVAREENNPHYYNSGGIYIGKRAWFLENRWPRHLHWGDMEDVFFTRRCELDGAVWRHDWANRVFTTTRRLGYVRRPRFGALGSLRLRMRRALKEAFSTLQRGRVDFH